MSSEWFARPVPFVADIDRSVAGKGLMFILLDVGVLDALRAELEGRGGNPHRRQKQRDDAPARRRTLG